MADSEEMRRLMRHAATLAEIQRDLMSMVAARIGTDEPTSPTEPEPPADGPRRTRRMGAQS